MARFGRHRTKRDYESLVNQDSGFLITEAYKNLRTNLLFSLSTSDKRSIVISSAEPSSGKTMTSANLSVTMAQTGNRVLIIDADMRKPKIHKVFQVDNMSGLSDLLSGNATEIGEVIHHSVASCVDLISSGPIPPNPSELLSHPRLTKLLDGAARNYSYVFIDTPPVNVVSDPLLIVKHTAGVLMVTRQRQTTFDEVQHAVEKFRDFNASILGLIVTDVQSRARRYGYYGQYGYGYGYYEYEYK
jgi:capsular exopolysaccharide synthesis family protein